MCFTLIGTSRQAKDFEKCDQVSSVALAFASRKLPEGNFHRCFLGVAEEAPPSLSYCRSSFLHQVLPLCMVAASCIVTSNRQKLIFSNERCTMQGALVLTNKRFLCIWHHWPLMIQAKLVAGWEDPHPKDLRLWHRQAYQTSGIARILLRKTQSDNKRTHTEEDALIRKKNNIISKKECFVVSFRQTRLLCCVLSRCTGSDAT